MHVSSVRQEQDVNDLLLQFSALEILPHVKKKIEKCKNHISHITHQLSSKNHGGKRFRTHQISLKDQISLATDRLMGLQKIEASLLQTLKKDGFISLFDKWNITNITQAQSSVLGDMPSRVSNVASKVMTAAGNQPEELSLSRWCHLKFMKVVGGRIVFFSLFRKQGFDSASYIMSFVNYKFCL